MFYTKVAAVMIGVCAATMGASAMAKTTNAASTDQVKVIVNYSDLDLSTDAGAKRLRERFDDAVTRIKGDDTDAFGSRANSMREAARRVAEAAADAVIKARRDAAAPTAPTVVSLG